MLQTSLINSTVDKYRKLKNFDAEVNRLKQDLANYCNNYIKSYYPERVFTALAKDTKGIIIKQREIDFWYRDLSKIPGLDSSIVSIATEFFYDIRKIPVASSQLLPFFFDAEDIVYDGEKNRKFREEFPEFTKTFMEKFANLILFAYECSKKLRALRSVLSKKEATLTSIKENYIELYNLIKS